MVYLYAMDIPRLNPDLATYRGIVPEGRLYQLSTLPQMDRMRGLAAELLFQRAVRRHCPGVPLPVARDRSEFGKPYLLGCPAFHFNLSHSGLWAVCAVADVPVGVDLQQERPISAKLSRQFTPAEQRMLREIPLEEHDRLLLDLWVEKEAYTKCTGQGILCSFRSFEAEHPAPGHSVQLVEFPVGGYHLAVCVQSPRLPEVQLIIMPT